MADVTITPASVLAGASAQVADGTAGATITAGQALYKDTADSDKLKLADCNAASPANVLAGVALHGASSGQPIKYLTGGLITIGGTVVAGTTYVLSATAGGICPTTDLASGHTVCHVGVATTTGIISVRIFNTGVTI